MPGRDGISTKLDGQTTGSDSSRIRLLERYHESTVHEEPNYLRMLMANGEEPTGRLFRSGYVYTEYNADG